MTEKPVSALEGLSAAFARLEEVLERTHAYVDAVVASRPFPPHCTLQNKKYFKPNKTFHSSFVPDTTAAETYPERGLPVRHQLIPHLLSRASQDIWLSQASRRVHTSITRSEVFESLVLC